LFGGKSRSIPEVGHLPEQTLLFDSGVIKNRMNF